MSLPEAGRRVLVPAGTTFWYFWYMRGEDFGVEGMVMEEDKEVTVAAEGYSWAYWTTERGMAYAQKKDLREVPGPLEKLAEVGRTG